MIRYIFPFWVFVLLSFTARAQDTTTVPSRIGFGSCLAQGHEQPMWNTVIAKNPDLFILLGDNIYGDTKDMDELRAKYAQLGSNPNFQKAKASFPIVATWDDHDYGQNDAGRNYPKKEESKEVFLDFFDEPENSPRRKHPGIYTAYIFEENGKRLQIILPDNRTFRSWLRVSPTPIKKGGHYRPRKGKGATMLGNEQWKWLENQLKIPADIRIIGTSTQFLCDFNGYEAWSNLPAERQRFIDLIKSTKANGVVFLSGDTHYAELSRLEIEDMYDLYDLTSSGMTQTWKELGPNRLRVGEGYLPNNFGMVSIDWDKEELTLSVFNLKGEEVIAQIIRLKDIEF